MKNENKTTSILLLIFPAKDAFWNQRKSLQNDSVNLLQLDESLIIFADQVFNEKGYKKEICRILGSE